MRRPLVFEMNYSPQCVFFSSLHPLLFLFSTFCFVFFLFLYVIQLAFLEPSNLNSGKGPALPALPTVGPAPEEPIFVPARAGSTGPTAIHLTPSAPVGGTQTKPFAESFSLYMVSFEKR